MLGIFLDDERTPSDVYWHRFPQDIMWCEPVRTQKEFTKLVQNIFDSGDNYFANNTLSDIFISFDHDLQDFDLTGQEYTGFTCLKWLCE